ncbi:hypothetical protein EsDP_00005723 [Epichloe bromicola]|uniref:F-box domain-containing protein n=1 Tax=Epichloe bromicola TaxID=79588 RepID=A0ABQ0CVI2_9HYPO
MANTFPTAPPGTCLIQKMPPEILLRISHYLSTADLGCLRLTSWSIERSLYTAFVNEFFTRKQFMITQESLQALIDVSKSRLGQHLRFVEIGLDRFPEVQDMLLDDEKDERFRKGYANTFTLWNTGHHRDMMAEAFRNLENLQDVVIRDFNSRRPSREGPFAKWRSYGYTTFFNETGVKLEHGGSSAWSAGFPYHYCSQAFAAVIYALGAAQARPRGIEIKSRSQNFLRDFAFNIPDFLQPSVVPILEGLEKLHLCIDPTWRFVFGEYHARGPLQGDLFLYEFLCHATNVKNLRINMHLAARIALPNLLAWIGGDFDSQASTDRTRQGDLVFSMPRLEKLSLGNISVDGPLLLKVVRKFAPSLKSLELWDADIVHRLPPDTPSTPAPRENLWDSFLEKLTEVPGLDLKHFKAGRLRQCWDEDKPPAQVSFKGYGAVCEYDGLNWKHFIGEIRPLLDGRWPEEHQHNNGEGEGTDDEDTDDEDIDDEEDASMLNIEDDAAGDDEQIQNSPS